ncbi:Mediator complex subunit Med17 [Penicillium macrosclerotiorum]|uniref:Mediator complex subunit Med17 n=1 Tax=Penicillium macrosclerotiorum TaxID=303699 RepID=UPI0025478761|nr:Mediator complex subunit Med17 [Penicillium macrosclerotiorum]KAJ5691787.1 Mediator complex subunit Med17 [Penicillium macrosclerotiorum]
MANSFTLPLRPPPEQQQRADSLPIDIAQINSQWGSFRNVNEELLRAKIAEEEENDGSSHLNEQDHESADVDRIERLEELYKQRAEITQFAVQSHMEAMFALDCVSLVLSKHAPRQAESSISSFLKQSAPIGSLDSEVVNPLPKPESAKKDISAVSRGWRTLNFNAASNKLLGAAARLETEITSETRYWDEVLAIKNKGWKVCRLPREKQALGVQYGFLEATPVFRDRGLASLRRAEDGSLILDKGLIPSSTCYVRVRVKQGSQFFVSSRPRGPGSDGADSIENRILQARDSVFEEELFHELVREARYMASCGATTRQNLIRIPASDDLEIMLDLIDVGDEEIHGEQNSTRQDTLFAEGLAHSIRILLAFAHRQNLRRRTQVPPPVTSKKRPTPEYHLLRPAMAYIQHLSHVRSLESFFRDIFGVLRSSGLHIPEYTSSLFSSWKPEPISCSAASLETLVPKFLLPVESVFQGTLLSPRSSFTVNIRTNMSFPPFGTSYDVHFDLPAIPDSKSPGHLRLKDEVHAAITHLLLLDVISTICSKKLPVNQRTSEPEPSKTRRWEALYPHLGELLLPNINPEKHKKMKVSLSREKLSLSTYFVPSIDGIGRDTRERRVSHPGAHIWTSPSPFTPESGEHPAMMDFVVNQASPSS